MPRKPAGRKPAAKLMRGLGTPKKSPRTNAAAKKVKVEPRPRNAEGTRTAILNAALRRFALNSYDDVSLREIAGDAGVDVALVGRYFESKDKLFAIVMNELLNPQYLFEGDRSTFGQRQAEAALCAEMDPNFSLTPILAIIRSVTSPNALPLLQEVSRERFTLPLAEWLGGKDAELRAHLIANLLSGSIVNRYVAKEHLEKPGTKVRYIARLAKALQALVDG